MRRGRVRTPKQVTWVREKHSFSPLLALLRFAYWIYICTRDRKGNDINSRKKHVREVIRLTHEHNRLDQRNLVSCPRFYLQIAGTSVGDEHSRGFQLSAPH